MNNILVVAAHPDDEILGLGGTIARFIKHGAVANCIILGEGLTSRKDSREETGKENLERLKQNTLNACNIIGYKKVDFFDFPDNRFDKADLLDIVKAVSKSIDKYNPNMIFTHFGGDLNIDHQLTFQAVMTATRPIKGINKVEKILLFETPSSTEWNFGSSSLKFAPNYFVNIEDTINDKLKAMDCYLTEKCDFPHPRSLKALEIISQRWGSVAGVENAEAFMLLREIVY